MLVEENEDTLETYSYQGTEVFIVTVFTSENGKIALVENINTGEQYEVYKDQLY